MATLPQIRDRILTKYQSLPTQREKLEFLYEVQEFLRSFYNQRGAQFNNGQITEDQWLAFKTQWFNISEKVLDRISILRDRVFVNDFGLTKPTSLEDEVASSAWKLKKEELKAGLTYRNQIETIWQ